MALNLDWHSQCHLAATGIRNTVESFAWSVMNLCPPLFMIEVLPLGYTPAPPRLPSSQPPSQPPVYQSRWQLLFTISLGTRDEFYTHPHDQLNAVIIFRHDGPSESCAVYMHTFEHYVRCILGQCLDLTSLPPSFRQAATLRHMANCTHFTACEGDGYCTLIIIRVLVLDFVVVSAKKGCIVRVHPPLPAPTPISPRPYTNIGGPLH